MARKPVQVSPCGAARGGDRAQGRHLHHLGGLPRRKGAHKDAHDPHAAFASLGGIRLSNAGHALREVCVGFSVQCVRE